MIERGNIKEGREKGEDIKGEIKREREKGEIEMGKRESE